MFRRTRYQQGSLNLEARKRGPAIWVYRWWDKVDGKCIRRKVQVGTLQQYHTESTAHAAADALRLTINTQSGRNYLSGTTVHTPLGALFSRRTALEGNLNPRHLCGRCKELGSSAMGESPTQRSKGIPEEIGLRAQNSQRTAWENKADITHLILALVPSAKSVARSQRSTSTVLTSQQPQRNQSIPASNFEDQASRPGEVGRCDPPHRIVVHEQVNPDSVDPRRQSVPQLSKLRIAVLLGWEPLMDPNGPRLSRKVSYVVERMVGTWGLEPQTSTVSR